MTAMTSRIDLEPLAELTYASIGQLETRKKLREVAVAWRTPNALFGAEPPGAGGTSGPALAAGLSAWC